MRYCLHWGSLFAGLVLTVAVSTAAKAEVQAVVEYQRTSEKTAINTVKIDCWATSKFGVRASWDWDNTGLSADLLYHDDAGERVTPYLGLGVRDLLDSSGEHLNELQRTEVIAGLELRITERVSLAAETRVTPLNWQNNPELKPILGLSLKWSSWLGADSAEHIGEQATWLLAKLITAEAGNEPYEGQVAVGAVVLNRLKSSDFPDTVRKVIYQEGQFSCLPKLGQIQPTQAAIRAAKEAVAGLDPTHGALYFYNPDKCNPEGLKFFSSPELSVTVRISNHVFLKPKQQL